MTDGKTVKEMVKRQACWQGKPYYSLDAYCKNRFHRKCFKIALNARMGCPNRDGTLGTGDCIFCSRGERGRGGWLSS